MEWAAIALALARGFGQVLAALRAAPEIQQRNTELVALLHKIRSEGRLPSADESKAIMDRIDADAVVTHDHIARLRAEVAAASGQGHAGEDGTT